MTTNDHAHLAATPQPAPHQGQRDVLWAALSALDERALAGTLKYGTPLMSFNGRDALEDWYQEQCDAFMYATQFMMEYRARCKDSSK